MNVADFAAVTVSAPPEAFYDVIAEMSTLGELSPQFTGGAWKDDQNGTGA